MIDIALRILDPRIGNEWPLPQAATSGAAGVDLRACIDAPLEIAPQASALVASGIAIHIGDDRYVALVVPRSGLGHRHGIVLGNGTGVIDSDYQGPLMISLWNRSDTGFTISPGDRVAQLLIVPVLQPCFRIVDSFASSARGSGGFGHSGTQ